VNFVDGYCCYVTTEKQTIIKGHDFINVNYNLLNERYYEKKFPFFSFNHLGRQRGITDGRHGNAVIRRTELAQHHQIG
jgi:hypothetical protein